MIVPVDPNLSVESTVITFASFCVFDPIVAICCAACFGVFVAYVVISCAASFGAFVANVFISISDYIISIVPRIVKSRSRC